MKTGARKGGSKTTANRTQDGKVVEAHGEADNEAGSVEGRVITYIYT